MKQDKAKRKEVQTPLEKIEAMWERGEKERQVRARDERLMKMRKVFIYIGFIIVIAVIGYASVSEEWSDLGILTKVITLFGFVAFWLLFSFIWLWLVNRIFNIFLEVKLRWYDDLN